MTFAQLQKLHEEKKPGRIHVINATDSQRTVLDAWTKRGWKVDDRKGAFAENLPSVMESAIAGDVLFCGDATHAHTALDVARWLTGNTKNSADTLILLSALELAAYPKLLWIGYSPLADYRSLPVAAKSIQAMINTLSRLGESALRVALLSCVELVSPGIASTVWQAPLAQMSARGQFGKACVDGPLGLDLAVSPEAVADKKVKTEIAGQADLVIPPDLNTYTSMLSALVLTGNLRAAQVLLGAPISIAFAPGANPDNIERSLEVAGLLS
ncbi:hypothetical protein KKH27_12125 [bacterium]|nr:hypothetical protein [bacterium]MBU1983570.1 hypothetical protein [bacterium]